MTTVQCSTGNETRAIDNKDTIRYNAVRNILRGNRRMGKSFWIIIAGVVILMFGAFLFFREDASAPSQPRSNGDPLEVTSQDHIRGAEEAAVTIIEYGDFQCPHCARAESTLETILDDFSGDVRLVYRHFPIASIHPHARDAARASEAAAQQDDFWAMHDLLFARQQQWSNDPNARETFATYAEQLGLDMEQYRSDFENTGDKVDSDLRIAQDLGVQSTPTFFVNGEQVESTDVLRQRIEAELNE